MSSKKNYALVLHQYESGYLALLDQQKGRFDVALERKRKKRGPISRGAIISYYLERYRNKMIATSIDLIDLPFVLAKTDILFLHHVLELSFVFLPVGAISHDAFQLIMKLYTIHETVCVISMQKLFLIRLLDILGLHPDHEKFQGAQFLRLIAGPIDTLLDKKLDLETKNYINAWLHDCLKSHPMIDSCKTAHFLNDVRKI